MKAHLPFPVDPLADEESIRDAFQYYLEDQFEDAEYHFGLLLPTHCVPLGPPGKPPSDPGSSSSLAQYESTEPPGVLVGVDAWRLAEEVAPGDVLHTIVQVYGEEVVASRETLTEGGVELDVLTRTRIQPDGEDPIIMRRRGIKDFDKFLLASVAVPEEAYAEVADQAAAILSGLKFLHPTGFPFAEPLATFSRAHPSDFLLLYPESWTLEDEPTGDPSFRSLRLEKSEGEELLGQNRLMIISREAALEREAVEGFVNDHWRQAGIEDARLEMVPVAPALAFDSQWQHISQHTGPDGATAELRVTLGERPDAWFVFMVVGPDRANAFDIWAVNRRCHEIMVEHLRTPDQPLEEKYGGPGEAESGEPQQDIQSDSYSGGDDQ